MTEIPKYDPDNIFAKIVRGDMPCTKIWEDEATLAFMDVFPQSEGHALIIPKRAKATMLFDLDTDALKELMASVQKVAKAVNKALKPDGMRIIQFNGPEAGQTVFHVHFHIIPIYAGQAPGAHADGKPADASRLAGIADRIAKEI